MAKTLGTIGTADNTSKADAAKLAALAAQALQEANDQLTANAASSSEAPTFDTGAYMEDLSQVTPQAPTQVAPQVDQLSQLVALAKALGLDMASLVAPSLAPQAQAARQAFAPKAERPGLVAEPNERRFPGGNLNPNAVITRIMPNPKDPSGASYYRYARYPQAPCTVQEVLSVVGGPTKADLLWDARKGFIAFD